MDYYGGGMSGLQKMQRWYRTPGTRPNLNEAAVPRVRWFEGNPRPERE
jgi:hypothetical protein